ncbi:MAG: SOS response-associated peptidase [Gemmatimonadetes bacterium]|nr:SOS response-associated peptidase [Gemmatimonadota bacterium]
MCGRYTLTAPEGALVEAFDVPSLTFDLQPRYNIAPGQPCPVVGEDREGRRIGLLEWGLLPAWKDEPKGPFINARAESVATKASFRDAFRRRRCLIPADGFYEWKTEDGKKRPYWLHPSDEGLLSFAGIWESWSRPGQEPRHGFAILTTDANAEVSQIHDRMPVIVEAGDRDAWLSRTSEAGALQRLTRPAPAGTLRLRPVSARVNRPSEDGPELLEPVADD